MDATPLRSRLALIIPLTALAAIIVGAGFRFFFGSPLFSTLPALTADIKKLCVPILDDAKGLQLDLPVSHYSYTEDSSGFAIKEGNRYVFRISKMPLYLMSEQKIESQLAENRLYSSGQNQYGYTVSLGGSISNEKLVDPPYKGNKDFFMIYLSRISGDYSQTTSQREAAEAQGRELIKTIIQTAQVRTCAKAY